MLLNSRAILDQSLILRFQRMGKWLFVLAVITLLFVNCMNRDGDERNRSRGNDPNCEKVKGHSLTKIYGFWIKIILDNLCSVSRVNTIKTQSFLTCFIEQNVLR